VQVQFLSSALIAFVLRSCLDSAYFELHILHTIPALGTKICYNNFMQAVHLHKTASTPKPALFALLIPGIVFTLVILVYLLIKDDLPGERSATTNENIVESSANIDR
jgi:hypothetical protein